MKIAIDISQICYEGTGVATYTYLLVKNLLKNDSVNDYILVGNSFRQFSKLEGFYNSCRKINSRVSSRFFRIPQTVANLFGNKFHYPDMSLLIGKVDIYHSSDWIEPMVSSKKITTVHDLVIIRYPELSDPYIVQTQKKRLSWVKKECNMVVTDSFATRDDLIKLLGFSHNKIQTVYPGIEEVFSKTSNSEVQRVKMKYGINSDYILGVGTLEPRKNINRIISSYEIFERSQLIISKAIPIQLVFAGKPGWGADVKHSKNVKFLGLIEKYDLPALYSGAKFFIYPSLFEGFGLPVLEAFACGCPVITSSRGSLAEIATGAALLVDPESTDDISVNMVKLIVDDDLRSDLIKKGKDKSLKFNWKKTANKMIDLYNKVYSAKS